MTTPSFTVDGPAQAPALVLLNSLGTTGGMWTSQIAALTPWFRVVRIEHPGHGGAPSAQGPYTVGGLGDGVLAVLDALDIDRAAVMGLSLGGTIAMWLGVHHPDRVESLVLCCTSPRFAPPEQWIARAADVRRDGTAPLRDAAMSRWFTQRFRDEHPEAVSRIADMLEGVDREGYAGCCEALAAADLRSDVARIRAPTLVVSGEQDPVVPPEAAASTVTSIDGASLTVLGGAAHLPNVERPDAFNEAVLAHLVGSVDARGMATRRAVLGDQHVDAALAASSEFSAPFQRFVTRTPWGELWARPGLDLRTRRLVTIGMLVALGRSEELSLHMRAAIRGGVDPESLREVLLHGAVYAGFPAANAAFTLANRILAEEVGPDPA